MYYIHCEIREVYNVCISLRATNVPWVGTCNCVRNGIVVMGRVFSCDGHTCTVVKASLLQL